MKTIAGWDRFVADARRDPILVPLWEGTPVTVHYPTKRKIREIFDDQSFVRIRQATLVLFGDETGQRLIDEAEDLQGAPLERMVLTVLAEFGLVAKDALTQFEPETGRDPEPGGDPDPNLSTSSNSSTGTDPTSNGTSPSGSGSTFSTTSEATAPSRN